MPRWIDSGSDARYANSASGVIGASRTSATALGCRGVSSAGSSEAPSRTYRSGGCSRWPMHWTAASISTSGGAARHSTGSWTSDMRRSSTSSSGCSVRLVGRSPSRSRSRSTGSAVRSTCSHSTRSSTSSRSTRSRRVVGEAGNTVLGVDRKSRLAPQIARDRGWPCRGVARFLVVADSSTSRDRIGRHSDTFRTAFPAGGRDCLAWIRDPVGEPPSGILFLAPRNGRQVSSATRPGRAVGRSGGRSRSTSNADLDPEARNARPATVPDPARRE